jgi:hypothetical protein
LGRLEPLFCKLEDENEEGVLTEPDDDEGDVCERLEGDDNAENAEVVEDKLVRVWSMFRSDWMTDGLSNLSRIEIVLTTSSNEWGSALMMAMTASSS